MRRSFSQSGICKIWVRLLHKVECADRESYFNIGQNLQSSPATRLPSLFYIERLAEEEAGGRVSRVGNFTLAKSWRATSPWSDMCG